jgi:MFS family permease
MPRPYLDLLRTNSSFRRLWFAQLISLGGDWFNAVALLGAVHQYTHSAFYAGLVLVANLLPFVVISMFSGILVDRLNRKKLMIVADIARIFLALGMLSVHSRGTVWVGLACQAGISAFGAFFLPASQAALPNLATGEQLGPANALAGASWGTMLVVGSALGGIVATVFGRSTAFIVNAASFAASAALILRIHASFSEARAKRESHPLRDIKEGFAYARSDGRVIALLATKSGYGIGAGVIGLLAVFGTDVFKAGEMGIGILFAARGLGALLGPFSARAFAKNDEAKLFISIGVATTVFGVGYALLPAMPVIWAAAAMAAVAHVGGGAQWMMSSYGLQRIVPDTYRGRIFALDFGLAQLALAAGILVAGRAAEAFGPKPTMAVMATLDIAYAAIWLTWTRRYWKRAALLPQPIGGLEVAPAEGGSGGVAAPHAEQLHPLEAAIPPRSMEGEPITTD